LYITYICIRTTDLTFKYVGCTREERLCFPSVVSIQRIRLARLFLAKRNATWYQFSIANTSVSRRVWGNSITQEREESKKKERKEPTDKDEVSVHAMKAYRASTDTEWGVCSWPWQLFVLEKARSPFFVYSNRRIPVKNTLGWNAVVFCVCVRQYRYFLSCPARLELRINLILGLLPRVKLRPVERRSCCGK
jgi:hypothetical protein